MHLQTTLTTWMCPVALTWRTSFWWKTQTQQTWKSLSKACALLTSSFLKVLEMNRHSMSSISQTSTSCLRPHLPLMTTSKHLPNWKKVEGRTWPNATQSCSPWWSKLGIVPYALPWLPWWKDIQGQCEVGCRKRLHGRTLLREPPYEENIGVQTGNQNSVRMSGSVSKTIGLIHQLLLGQEETQMTLAISHLTSCSMPSEVPVYVAYHNGGWIGEWEWTPSSHSYWWSVWLDIHAGHHPLVSWETLCGRNGVKHGWKIMVGEGTRCILGISFVDACKNMTVMIDLNFFEEEDDEVIGHYFNDGSALEMRLFPSYDITSEEETDREREWSRCILRCILDGVACLLDNLDADDIRIQFQGRDLYDDMNLRECNINSHWSYQWWRWFKAQNWSKTRWNMACGNQGCEWGEARQPVHDCSSKSSSECEQQCPDFSEWHQTNGVWAHSAVAKCLVWMLTNPNRKSDGANLASLWCCLQSHPQSRGGCKKWPRSASSPFSPVPTWKSFLMVLVVVATMTHLRPFWPIGFKTLKINLRLKGGLQSNWKNCEKPRWMLTFRRHSVVFYLATESKKMKSGTPFSFKT